MNWYDDHWTLFEVARYIEELDGFSDVSEAMHYIEKPWKWQDMYHRWAERAILDELAVSEEHHA